MEALPPVRVVLIGMMGSGKTSVGRALSDFTGWPYLDNDDLVRTLTGRPPEDVAATHGEAGLHDAEEEALRMALARTPPLIVGAAAGLVEDSPGSLAALEAESRVIYLRAPVSTLRSRIGRGEGRREDAVDEVWLQERLDQRDQVYRDLAWMVVDVEALDVEAAARAIAVGLGGDRSS